MPGKLLDAAPGVGALGLLASAYTDSDSNDENEKEVVNIEDVERKENEEIRPNGKENNGTSSVVENAVIKEDLSPPEIHPPTGPSVKSEVVPEKFNEETLENSQQTLVVEQMVVEEKGIGNGLEKAKGSAEDEDVEIIATIDYSTQPFSTPQNIENVTISDSETSSDSDLDSESDDSGDGTKGGRIRQPPRVKGELLISDLPPIEDLHISVPHEQCEAIGTIKSIVDTLVVVESYPNSPALNLDTVLFMEQGDQTLGHIFDVFGSVNQPHYCVRFNSKEHMSTRGVEIGKLVYCAPKTEYTSYVLLGQLRLLRGTDASWQDDIEPPPEEIEFSDDETERVVKKGGRKHPVSADNPNLIEISPSPGFSGRGRGRKRCANYGNAEMMQQGDGVFNQSTIANNKPPFVPPFVSGFHPPSMRFQGSGPRPFGPGYGRGFYPPGGYQSRPYYPPPPPPRQSYNPNPMQNPYFQGNTANNSPYGSSFGNYNPLPPPPPPRPSEGQPAWNSSNGNRSTFNNYAPPPPPPRPRESQAARNSSNGNGSTFNNYAPPPPPPRAEGPKVPQRQYY